jgi:hypothetical protein
MEPFDPWRRMGSHGRLIDASLLRVLLVPGPAGAAALDWLEGVGDGLLKVSAWSVMELEGELGGEAAHRLLDDFLLERCPVVCFEPDDFAMVRHRQRHRPGIAALPLLLQLQLAYRLGLLPVTLDRDLGAAAGALSYPVEMLGFTDFGCLTSSCFTSSCFTNSAWGAASRKPSCS